MWFCVLTFSVAGLSVLIVTKSSDRNWVSSNTVRSTWGAWSSALSAQKCLSGEKLTCPDCDPLFHRKVCQVRSLVVPIVANVSIGAGFPATPFCPLGQHGPVLCLHRNVRQVWSLAVPIVAKRFNPDWVSSNTVPYIREALSSAVSACQVEVKSLTVRIVANYGDLGPAAIIVDPDWIITDCTFYRSWVSISIRPLKLRLAPDALHLGCTYRYSIILYIPISQ